MLKKTIRKHYSSNLWSNHKGVSKQWSKQHKVVWCILTTCSAQCLGIKCTLDADWWIQETHVAPKTEEAHGDIKTKSWNYFLLTVKISRWPAYLCLSQEDCGLDVCFVTLATSLWPQDCGHEFWKVETLIWWEHPYLLFLQNLL